MKTFSRFNLAVFLGTMIFIMTHCQKADPQLPNSPNPTDSAKGLNQYLNYTFMGDSVPYVQNIDSFQVRISSPMNTNSLVCFRKNQADSFYFDFYSRWDLKEGYIEHLYFKKNGVTYNYVINTGVLAITKFELTEFGEKGFEDDKGGYIAGKITTALLQPGTTQLLPLKVNFRFKRKY